MTIAIDLTSCIKIQKDTCHCILKTQQKLNEDCFELRGFYHEEPNLGDSINFRRIRNIKIAHPLILKSRQPGGLNLGYI